MSSAGIRSVIRNSSFLLGSHFLTVLIRVIYVVIVARLLGPSAYGTLNYGMSWYLTLIALTYLGLDIVLAREVGRGHGAAAVLAGTTLSLRIGVAIVVAFLSAVAALIVESDFAARNLILVLSAALFGRAVWLWCVSVFTAFEDTRNVLAIDFLFRPLEVFVVVVILLLAQSAEASILAIGVAHATLWCFQGTIGVLVVRRRATPIVIRVVWHEVRSLLMGGISGALYTLTVAWFMQAPIVLFRLFVGTGEILGHFSVALQIVGYLIVVPYLAASAVLPVLARSVVRGDRKDKIAVWAMLIVVPTVGIVLGFVGIWLARPLTTLAFGTDFEIAGMILEEAIWLLIPFGLAVGLQQAVFARWKNVTMVSFSGVIGGITTAVLFAPLAQALSYSGALLATGLGIGVWVVCLILALARAGIFDISGAADGAR